MLIRLILVIAIMLLGYGYWLQSTNRTVEELAPAETSGGIPGILESADGAARSLERDFNTIPTE